MPTFNVGTIVGGTAGNILARECEVLGAIANCLTAHSPAWATKRIGG